MGSCGLNIWFSCFSLGGGELEGLLGASGFFAGL
jgi:hypothetical protein